MTADLKVRFEKARRGEQIQQNYASSAPQTAIPLNGRTDFTAAWVRLREEGEVL